MATGHQRGAGRTVRPPARPAPALACGAGVVAGGPIAELVAAAQQRSVVGAGHRDAGHSIGASGLGDLADLGLAPPGQPRCADRPGQSPALRAVAAAGMRRRAAQWQAAEPGVDRRGPFQASQRPPRPPGG
ncbi:hypothetical protein G6F35_014050 [Rhizopus arrhizus]|nr:hypothetical protein G6F35_014050 [Rhizopus arrhizus]